MASARLPSLGLCPAPPQLLTLCCDKRCGEGSVDPDRTVMRFSVSVDNWLTVSRRGHAAVGGYWPIHTAATSLRYSPVFPKAMTRSLKRITWLTMGLWPSKTGS